MKLLEHQNQLLDQRLIDAHSRSQALSTQLSTCKCLAFKDELSQVKNLYKESVDEKEILRARVRALEGELTAAREELRAKDESFSQFQGLIEDLKGREERLREGQARAEREREREMLGQIEEERRRY